MIRSQSEEHSETTMTNSTLPQIPKVSDLYYPVDKLLCQRMQQGERYYLVILLPSWKPTENVTDDSKGAFHEPLHDER